jgi:hypothetical protein
MKYTVEMASGTSINNTESLDNRARHSSNIKGNTSTTWEVVVLVLMMREIYDVHYWGCLRWHHTHITSCMKIDTGLQAILRFCLRNERGCNVVITDGTDLRCTTLRWIHVAWYTYHVSRIGIGLQAISRFGLSNLNGCNVGINGKRFFFLFTPLRLAQIPWYSYQVSSQTPSIWKIPNGSDDAACHSGLLGFWTLSDVWYSKKHEVLETGSVSVPMSVGNSWPQSLDQSFRNDVVFNVL